MLPQGPQGMMLPRRPLGIMLPQRPKVKMLPFMSRSAGTESAPELFEPKLKIHLTI